MKQDTRYKKIRLNRKLWQIKIKKHIIKLLFLKARKYEKFYITMNGGFLLLMLLKLEAPDGKMRETDCANTETMLRIIQSIPSPKAEPLKRWLARVGYERVQEIEDPELATKRTRILYKLKGYPEDWIRNNFIIFNFIIL